MSRRASGNAKVLAKAHKAISCAQTLAQLRQAQAVALPLLGLSLEETAESIGLSRGWTCRLRTSFMRGEVLSEAKEDSPGGRRNQNMDVEEEREFLAQFFERAACGGILVVREVKAALEKRLDRKVALASVYNLLHRHDWRKIVPDKSHPKSDPEKQVDWKKNSPKRSPSFEKTGQKESR